MCANILNIFIFQFYLFPEMLNVPKKLITTIGVCICKITPQDISSCNFSMWHIDWGYKDGNFFNLKFDVCGDGGIFKGVALMQMKL